ncbi:type I restriction endonuclease [Allohahella sp. A8]|uniref:type I restriction endonuclease n=1 Tax=Allohahella sp. A8 TaxID=3141461 RepID=UPI003A7FD864
MSVFLAAQYAGDNITAGETESVIQQLDSLPEQRVPLEGEVETLVLEPAAAYDTGNIFRLVNQLVVEGTEKRIPDAILYINGLPLVVFELKSAVRENATIPSATESWPKLGRAGRTAHHRRRQRDAAADRTSD